MFKTVNRYFFIFWCFTGAGTINYPPGQSRWHSGRFILTLQCHSGLNQIKKPTSLAWNLLCEWAHNPKGSTDPSTRSLALKRWKNRRIPSGNQQAQSWKRWSTKNSIIIKMGCRSSNMQIWAGCAMVQSKYAHPSNFYSKLYLMSNYLFLHLLRSNNLIHNQLAYYILGLFIIIVRETKLILFSQWIAASE